MANKIMTARYAGTCGTCTGPIAVGTEINYAGKGRTSHATCAVVPAGQAAVSRRRSSSRYTAWDRRGRCEDAPCCGCCD